MKYQITFLKTTEKASSKCHNSSKVERNFNRKLKGRYEFLCTLDLKEQVKINDFFLFNCKDQISHQIYF